MQEQQKQHVVIWFGNNLRVSDNEAFHEACKAAPQVTAVYFFDPREYAPTGWGFPKTGGHRLRFLLESLEALQTSLGRLNIPLHLESAKPEYRLPKLISQWQVQAIYKQNEWTHEERRITEKLKASLTIPVHEYYDQFLFHPEDIPYRPFDKIPEVFTAFRKTVEAACSVRPLLKIPVKKNKFPVPAGLKEKHPAPEDLGITPTTADPRTAFPFSGGSAAAVERIDHYFWKTRKLAYYKHTRNGLTGIDYSSKLSPWLANGSISARQVWHEVKRFESEITSNQDTYWLIFELLWRDYFKYISLKHGDKIFFKGGIKGRRYDWKQDMGIFDQWRNGHTGNDFIDANMTELRLTGWMSNRGRQNAASYWAKSLEQDWRLGAAWFESMLLDYDVHSNWGNWMYVSGVGNDPRDRKFNTRLQADRYDKNGSYRNLWLQPTLF